LYQDEKAFCSLVQIETKNKKKLCLLPPFPIGFVIPSKRTSVVGSVTRFYFREGAKSRE
jgi:hypothetical protein